MYDRKEIGNVIIDLCKIVDGLTNWEMEFIDNMAERWKMELDFKEQQVNKMYEILNSKG